MLIESYQIELSCPACEPGSEVWMATVTTSVELSELMPYVNALVRKGEYTPGVPTLVWREGAHKFFLRPRQLGISNLGDRSDAEGEVDRLVHFLNETWDARERTTPDFSVRSKPKVLEILRLSLAPTAADAGYRPAWHTPLRFRKATRVLTTARH